MSTLIYMNSIWGEVNSAIITWRMLCRLNVSPSSHEPNQNYANKAPHFSWKLRLSDAETVVVITVPC